MRGHNAATNCYRIMDTLAGNLCCQLGATGVNFFAAGRSALGILPGKNTKCRGGRIPRCANAAPLDGSMTLMHVCAGGDRLSHHSPACVGPRFEPSPYSGFRPPFCDFRPGARLLASGGSTICLSQLKSVSLLRFHHLRSYRGKRRVNLGHETALAC